MAEKVIMSLKIYKVGMRLGAGFGTVLLLMVVIIAVGISSMAHINDRLDKIINEENYKIRLNNAMSESVHVSSRIVHIIVLLRDPAAIELERKKLLGAREEYDKSWAAFNKTEASDADKARRAAIRAAAEMARELSDQVLELGVARKDAAAIDLLLSRAGPAIQKWQDALDENIVFQESNIKSDAENATTAYWQARTLMFGFGGMAIALSMILAWFITRSITRPLQQAVTVASAVAQGDLTQHVEVKSKDETGQLLQALMDMNESLSGIVGNVHSATDSIIIASRQIAAGNSDLSQRTEVQASSLEETASSMEELTSTVRQNAENAKHANQMATMASTAAMRSAEVTSSMIGNMDEISDASTKIVDIISVIEGIAFQTNILALNAAVEAAHAGEQGRGFAVVAGEVRNLAQRSAAAAKEIKSLIGDSVEKVTLGSQLLESTVEAISEVVGEVRRVTDLVAEISAASIEQSAGIEQVNQAITQMDEVTQQNAALVEEAAAVAESMQEQANVLMEAVSVFKLEAVGGMAGHQTRTVPVHPVHSAPRYAVSSTAGAPVKRIPKLGKSENDTEEWKEF